MQPLTFISLYSNQPVLVNTNWGPGTVKYNLTYSSAESYSVAEIWYFLKKRNENDKNTDFMMKNNKNKNNNKNNNKMLKKYMKVLGNIFL